MEILNGIESQVRQFKEFVPSYARRLDAEAAARINALLPESEEMVREVGEEKSKLALLSARFTRPTLNIGVAGRAGQGKSTLIQRLSGLTKAEIPSGSGGHCTGAPSIIVNRDSGETFAEINFHTAPGFLQNVIAPFFEHLRLGNAPYTLDEFATMPIPETVPVGASDLTTDTEYLRKLREFRSRLPMYRDRLTGETHRVTRAEIRSFVAQQEEQKNEFGEPISLWNWVAVRMATIYCPFPHSDLGAVALADTPGLGDFLSGAEERLIATVGQTLDAVLFVRRPPVDPQWSNQQTPGYMD